jgi:flagellar basal-body rod modification protein FlgD
VDLRFTLSQDGAARLEIVDLAGRVVRTLFQGATAAGTHDAHWDGRDDRGAIAPAGLYFVRLTTRESIASRRLVWLR